MKAVERRGRSLLALRCLVPLGGLACALPGHAEVTFEPSVAAGVAHTDNLTLVAVDPEPETVYELIPSFGLRQRGARMSSDIHYRAEGYYYANRSDSSVYQIYNADFLSALDPGNFFLGFGASRDQTISDPASPIPRTNLPISTNRIDRDDYYVGPNFQYRVGSDLTLHGNYKRTRTHYGKSETGALLVPEYDTDATAFSVDNYRKERGFTWAVDYSGDRTDYGELFPTWEYRHAGVEVGAWVGKGARFYASAGKESPWDDPFDASLKDTFSEVGFTKRVGRDFSVDLAAGERSFGSSRRASLNYTFLHGQTQLSYSEQPATQGRMPTDYLTRPGAAERFILKRFDWGFGVRLLRTEVSFSIYDETREQRTSIDGTPLDDQAQSGGTFVATWHVGVKTAFSLGAEDLNQKFSAGSSQDLRSVWIAASRTLGPRTNLGLTVTRGDSQTGNAQNDYKANLISLLLTRKL